MHNRYAVLLFLLLILSSLQADSFLDPVTSEGYTSIETNISSDKLHDKYWDNGSSYFIKIYGNYGGLGNRGGEPRDKLDRVFQKHDYRYGEYGFLDAKSDARLLEEIPSVLFYENIQGEGYIVGPAIFVFFAAALPSLYRTEPFGKGITLPIPVPNTSFALYLYQLEKAYEFLKDKKRVNREFKRLKEQVENTNEDTNDWLKEQKDDTEDFLKKVF